MDTQIAQFLRTLVCPVTRCVLTYDPDTHELISKDADLAYPIREGIPVMLPEEARKLASHPEYKEAQK